MFGTDNGIGGTVNVAGSCTLKIVPQKCFDPRCWRIRLGVRFLYHVHHSGIEKGFHGFIEDIRMSQINCELMIRIDRTIAIVWNSVKRAKRISFVYFVCIFFHSKLIKSYL